MPRVANKKLKFASIAAVVTFLGTLGGYGNHVYRGWEDLHKPIVEQRYIFLKDDCLNEFVSAKDTDFGKWRVSHPRFVPNPLLSKLQVAFSPGYAETHGDTVRSAIFLTLKNISGIEDDKVTITSSDGPHDIFHFLPGETIIFNLEVKDLHGVSKEISVSEVQIIPTRGRSRRILLDGPPAESGATVDSLAEPCFSLGYPPDANSRGNLP